MKQARRRSPWLRPAGVLLLAGIVGGCGGEVAPETQADALPVEVVKAKTRQAADRVRVAGTVHWQTDMLLSFRVPGIVAALPVDIGDEVRRGQLLAEIDARDYDARLAEARAEVDRSERTLARYAALSKTGAVSRAQYYDQRDSLAQARAALAAAYYDRVSARLVAPSDGVVLERSAEAGETVSAGQAVLRLGDRRSPLLVRAAVPPASIARVRAGATARFWPNGPSGAAVSGKVSRVGRQVDARMGTIEVEVQLAPGSHVLSGTIGTLEIDAPPSVRRDLVAIPAEAVVEAGASQAVVFLLDQKAQKAVRRVVRFSGFAGEDALVSGILPGAPVITSGAGFVVDGQSVRVTTRGGA